MTNDPASALISARVQNMKEYFFALANEKIKEAANTGVEILNFGMGTPDLAPPSDVLKELAARALSPAEYLYPSYNGLPALRQALANWYTQEYQVQVDEKNILPISGSKEAIFFTSLAFLNEDDEVLIPDPGYPTYANAVQLVGAQVRTYPLLASNGYLPDLETLAQADLSHVKMMWINYPHNPTGAVAQISDYEAILAFTRAHHIILVSDNPYSHVTFGSYKAPSILQISTAADLVIELDSMSKTFNLAGLRLAWITGHATLMSALKTVYSNIETGIFTASQHAAVVALSTDADWIRDRNFVYEARAKQALLMCQKLKCTATPPQGSLYLWAKLPSDIKSASDFCFDLLARKGIFIAPGSAFGNQGEGHLRIALCQPETVFQKAISRLETP